MAIAYLGPEASWTHEAARRKFGEEAAYLPLKDIADIFQSVHQHTADYGVAPVENSTEGAITQTLDLLVESDLKICGQILLSIENNLLARGTREEIARIYSHPQVFGQCRDWLRREMPGVEKIEVSSSTRAAELASAEPAAAALAGPLAARVYGLTILERAVQDRPDNTTRFLVIGRQDGARTGHDQTSFMFAPRDETGALSAALRALDQLKIDLHNIESRPSRRRAWQYLFFIDLAGHREDALLLAASHALRQHCDEVKILGSYPVTKNAL